MNLLIIGTGRSGTAIADAWRSLGPAEQRHQAWTTSRSAETCVALERAGNVAVRAAFDGSPLPTLGSTIEAAVICFAPSRDETPSDETVAAVHWAADAGVKHLVYLSSTGVYGDGGGAEHDAPVVSDDTPVAPNTKLGQRRAITETAVAAACEERGVHLTRLRLPGIYGPSDSVLERLQAGTYELVDDGSLWSNRVHVADIASAVLHVLEHRLFGAVLASDGTPFQLSKLVEFAVAEWGFAPPNRIPLSEVSERARPFYKGPKRCNPVRLFDSGWRPTYPSYKEGLRAIWSAQASAD